MRTINLKNEKSFFTKCNATHRYSDRIMFGKSGIFVAISADLVGGVEWTVYKMKNASLSDVIFACDHDKTWNEMYDNGDIEMSFTASGLGLVQDEIKEMESTTDET